MMIIYERFGNSTMSIPSQRAEHTQSRIAHRESKKKDEISNHLEYESKSNYSHEEVVFSDSFEAIEFFRLSSIKLIEYLWFEKLSNLSFTLNEKRII